MTEACVTILDVGHGLCVVLHDQHGTVVFDYPSGPIPRDFFRTIGVDQIDATFISHTHRDHCEGLTGHLGEDFPIGVIVMNPRREQPSRLHTQLMRAIVVAKRSDNPPRLVHFNADVREACMERGRVRIDILGPESTTDYEAPGSPRERDDEHTSCGVARISYDGRARVLLPGDLNSRGLDAIIEQDPDALAADVLVFPHHGGLTGSADPRAFAHRFTSLVNPRMVMFSQARDKHERPYRAIIEGVRSAAPHAYISCTQLSRGCDRRSLHETAPRQDITLPAAGLEAPTGACCGGPLEIDITAEPARLISRTLHRSFVREQVDLPLCGAHSRG